MERPTILSLNQLLEYSRYAGSLRLIGAWASRQARLMPRIFLFFLSSSQLSRPAHRSGRSQDTGKREETDTYLMYRGMSSSDISALSHLRYHDISGLYGGQGISFVSRPSYLSDRSVNPRESDAVGMPLFTSLYNKYHMDLCKVSHAKRRT